MNVKDIRRKNLRTLSRSVGGVTQLANRLEKSQSQISHLIGTHPVKNIGDKFAAHVERVFNKVNGWLDHEHEGIEEENAIYSAQSTRQNFYRVPVLTWQATAEWLEKSGQVDSSANHLTYIITSTHVSLYAFALRVEGDSMEAAHGVSFPPGSIIVIDPEYQANNGAFVLAKQSSTGSLVFKQYVIDGSRRYLKPLNPRYPIVEITPQAMICGVVRLLIHEFK